MIFDPNSLLYQNDLYCVIIPRMKGGYSLFDYISAGGAGLIFYFLFKNFLRED
jgi:hypothetical protein